MDLSKLYLLYCLQFPAVYSSTHTDATSIHQYPYIYFLSSPQWRYPVSGTHGGHHTCNADCVRRVGSTGNVTVASRYPLVSQMSSKMVAAVAKRNPAVIWRRICVCHRRHCHIDRIVVISVAVVKSSNWRHTWDGITRPHMGLLYGRVHHGR